MYFASPFIFPLAPTFIQYFPNPLLDAPVALVGMALSCEHFAINLQVQVAFRSELKLITQQMSSICHYS